MTPPGGQHDAVRCWLGLGSSDPLRCGLNSAHPTFAMRNLLQFAKSLRGCTMLPCFCIARLTHVLPCRFRAASLLVAWCHGWVGWGTKICCRSSLPFQGGCIRSQLRSRLPDGGRMSSGSVVYSRWVQARCRHSLNSFAEGPACRCWVRNWVPDSTMPFVALGPRSNDPPAVA